MNQRRQRILLFVLLLITVGFVALSVVVHIYPDLSIDVRFSRDIQEHQNETIDGLMYAISTPGYMPESVIMVLGTALIFFLFKYKKAAGFVLLTSLSGLVSTIVKAVVNRPRPSDTLVRIVKKTAQQSFPSGHVLFYVVFFGFMILLMLQLEKVPKWIRYPVIVVSTFLIFTIPISRIYLGAHWFTDVVGGFLLGLPCLYVLAYYYLRKPADRQEAPVAETK
ncbi:phosphatase PAP2 family protein [Mucilaginibacter achroorhodeus]|uniref:Phosphatase PAP2 family protein n=1 Tax=Mucilaginibacter achroorhodeus TaxID=2599294 RepID=A0A563UA00_9SPHI|nr:phosphatase PAP2 family protein [Mucilaginibacter achroorhodeus]TWR28099.1 phosphatase PAP2 family protein [Mucilaginibacter achroorhodeus]